MHIFIRFDRVDTPKNNNLHDSLNTEVEQIHSVLTNLLIKALYIGLQCYSQCKRLSHRTL